MFQRVIVEDWALNLPVFSLVFFAGLFVLLSVRALRLGEAERRYLASLPLDEKPAGGESDGEHGAIGKAANRHRQKHNPQH
jgi:hypothetical protein